MREASALARGVLVWLVPFAIVAAVLGFETDWGRDVDGDQAQTPSAGVQPVSVALLPEYRLDGGLEARKETVDRVLFNPTRRPAPPATATAASASSMRRGQYQLTGTTMVGSVATAFLKEVNGGKSRSVRKGETLDGMLVAEVAPDHVRLKQGDEVEDLALKVAAGPRTTVQIAAPVAPATGQPGGQTNAGAAQPAAGGTAAARPPTRPVAPPPAPAAPGAATPRAGGPTSVSEVLAERRRAARAAAEAAAAGRSPTPGQQ
jgi:hypothetical protein